MILGLPPTNQWVPRNQTPLHTYIKALREAYKSGNFPATPIVAPDYGIVHDEHLSVYDEGKQNTQTPSQRHERRTESLREQSVLRERSVSKGPAEAIIESDETFAHAVIKRKRHDSTQPFPQRHSQNKYVRASTGKFKRSVNTKDQLMAKEAKHQIRSPKGVNKGNITAHRVNESVFSDRHRKPTAAAKLKSRPKIHSNMPAYKAQRLNMILPPCPSDSDTLEIPPERLPPSQSKHKSASEARTCVKRRAVAVWIPVRADKPQPSQHTQASSNNRNEYNPFISDFDFHAVQDSTNGQHENQPELPIDQIQPENNMANSQEVKPMTHSELQKQLRRDLKTLLRYCPPYAVVEARILPMVQLVIEGIPENRLGHEHYWLFQDLSRAISCWCSLIRRFYKAQGIAYTDDMDTDVKQRPTALGMDHGCLHIRQSCKEFDDPFLVDHDQIAGEAQWRPDMLSEDLTLLFGIILDMNLPFGYEGFLEKLRAYNTTLLGYFSD